MKWIDVDGGDGINSEIVEGLMKMLDDINELVKEFRVDRDRFKDSPYVDLKIVLKVCRSQSGRENHISNSNEVAAIMVGDVEDPCASRDIIIKSKTRGLERITNIHPKLMSLQYPLLFSCGEDGFHPMIKYIQREENKGKKRKKCTMMEFYFYKFQVRHNEGDSDARIIGKSFILPAGFVGSKHYMQQNFQGALVVCRHVGHPDIFLTMTSNPMWDEIMQMLKLIPVETSVDNPDIVARVFQLKLDHLLNDIKKEAYFGICIGGHDRATVEVRGQRRKKLDSNEEVVDEIQPYIDGRDICASEASYRTFGFDIHHRSISVERLSFHFPGKKNYMVKSNENLKKVVSRNQDK